MNLRIPQVPKIVSHKNDYLIPIWVSDTDVTSAISVLDLIGASQSVSINWSPVQTYVIGDVVEYDNKLWKSLINDNNNNEPAEDANWTEVSKSPNLNEWQAGIYVEDFVLVEYNLSLYKLSNGVGRPYDSLISPDTDVNWDQVSGGGPGGSSLIEENFHITNDLDVKTRWKGYIGPIEVDAIDDFDGGVTSSLQTFLDATPGTIITHANIGDLNSWIVANIIAGVKWQLRIISLATKPTNVTITYHAL